MFRHSIPVLICGLLCAVSTPAQTRKGPAPQAQQNVLRAVSVYEWTGDLAKPAAARIVPVSLFIDHHFEDAALYLSRPMPLALEPDTIYELEAGGVNQGTLTLLQPSHLRHTNAVTSFDEGWFSYGAWKPVVAPKPFVPSSTTSDAHVITSGETGPPRFSKTPAPQTPAASSPPATAQNKPSDTPGTASQNDPDRPVLHHTAPGDPQRGDAQGSGNQTTGAPPSTSSAPSAPATAAPPADQSKPGDTTSASADRPTLRRAPPADQRKSRGNNSASVTDAGGLLADDPNRPHLHHGVAAADIAPPALHGLPPGMHQMAAVSDAAERPEHNFVYTWADANQKAAMMMKLETLARTALAPATSHAIRTAPVTAHKRKAAAPAPAALLDENLRAFEISYGGVDVFVFAARTEDHRYVTLLAQTDIYGVPHLLLQHIAGATQLDQTPQMLFIDAVDADGDNRAELLFELRGETQRQFALYRITQDTAEQTFLSGTMQ